MKHWRWRNRDWISVTRMEVIWACVCNWWPRPLLCFQRESECLGVQWRLRLTWSATSTNLDKSKLLRTVTRSVFWQSSRLVQAQLSFIHTSCQCIKLFMNFSTRRTHMGAHYACDVGYTQEACESITWDNHCSNSAWASYLNSVGTFLRNVEHEWHMSLCLLEVRTLRNIVYDEELCVKYGTSYNSDSN